MGITVSILEEKGALKEYRKNRYEDIHRRLTHGATGEQVIASLTCLADDIIEQLYRKVIKSMPSNLRLRLEEGFTIVALGGYGRGELAPFSDIDLMFLHRDSLSDIPKAATADILQTLWDIGYHVGHSFRTVDECLSMGKKDLTIRTSLMEARFLAGSQRLFNRFRAYFDRKIILRRPDLFVKGKINCREQEYKQYGTTVYLLEPHIKMSRGGLRDLHIFQWAALCYYHTASLQTLKHQGILSLRDYKILTDAQEFLWRIRNELHFHACRCQDLLTLEEQIRLSHLWGYQDKGHLLGVERFMKEYYEKTTAMVDVIHQLLKRMREGPFTKQIKNLLRRRSVDSKFLITGDEISIYPEERSSVLESQRELLRLFQVAQAQDVKLSDETQILIKSAQEVVQTIATLERETAFIFLRILGSDKNVARILRELHRFRILEQIIPEFSHARGLMQFNEYHKYTVDEHCLLAVEEAELIGDQQGRIAQVYKEIEQKDILHLALLIHDLGKGQGPDHSTFGLQIAERTVERMGLNSQASGLLTFLVQYHLLMTRIAFRRDLSDEKVLLNFVKTVATPEVLKMLYILTFADVAAVGPGTLTAWKKDLLTELFEKTLEILTGEKVVIEEKEKIEKIKESILSHTEGSDKEWIARQISFMTSRYLISTPFNRIVKDLSRIRDIPSERVFVDAEYDPVRLITEYTIYTSDDLTPGIFYKIAGVLASKGLQILGASIITWEDGTVVDRFQVEDPDFTGNPGERRLEDVSASIKNVLLGSINLEELLDKGKRIQARRRAFPIIIPTRVEIDNASSEQCTIIEVFAQDRQGLLYAIAKAMFDLGLSVHTAKVSTQLDQIVDVFYVTDRSGGKIKDLGDIQKIKDGLNACLP